MSGVKRRFKGLIYKGIPDQKSFEGTPRTTSEEYELDINEAQKINARLPGVPICSEHGCHVPVGEVTDSYITPGRDWYVEFTLPADGEGPGPDLCAYADLNWENGLSLSHYSHSLEPLEVSVCQRPARAGCYITEGTIPITDEKKTGLYNQKYQASMPRIEASAKRTLRLNSRGSTEGRLIVASMERRDGGSASTGVTPPVSSLPSPSLPLGASTTTTITTTTTTPGGSPSSSSPSGTPSSPLISAAFPDFPPPRAQQVAMQLHAQGVRMHNSNVPSMGDTFHHLANGRGNDLTSPSPSRGPAMAPSGTAPSSSPAPTEHAEGRDTRADQDGSGGVGGGSGGIAMTSLSSPSAPPPPTSSPRMSESGAYASSSSSAIPSGPARHQMEGERGAEGGTGMGGGGGGGGTTPPSTSMGPSASVPTSAPGTTGFTGVITSLIEKPNRILTRTERKALLDGTEENNRELQETKRQLEQAKAELKDRKDREEMNRHTKAAWRGNAESGVVSPEYQREIDRQIHEGRVAAARVEWQEHQEEMELRNRAALLRSLTGGGSSSSSSRHHHHGLTTASVPFSPSHPYMPHTSTFSPPTPTVPFYSTTSYEYGDDKYGGGGGGGGGGRGGGGGAYGGTDPYGVSHPSSYFPSTDRMRPSTEVPVHASYPTYPTSEGRSGSSSSGGGKPGIVHMAPGGYIIGRRPFAMTGDGKVSASFGHTLSRTAYGHSSGPKVMRTLTETPAIGYATSMPRTMLFGRDQLPSDFQLVSASAPGHFYVPPDEKFHPMILQRTIDILRGDRSDPGSSMKLSKDAILSLNARGTKRATYIS